METLKREVDTATVAAHSVQIDKLDKDYKALHADLRELDGKVDTGFNELKSLMASLSNRLAAGSRPNLGVIATVAGVLLAGAAGLWGLAIKPISEKQLSQDHEAERQSAWILETTRAVNTLRTESEAGRVERKEIETQMCRLSQLSFMRDYDDWRSTYAHEHPEMPIPPPAPYMYGPETKADDK